MSLRFRAACAAAMLLVLSSAFADERCTLGFDAGSFDACAQRAALFDHALAALPGEARGARHSWWVVKFPGPIGATERAALQAIGAEAVDYLPHHALRVRMALDAFKQTAGKAGDYQVEGAKNLQTLNIGGSFGTVVSFVVESA